MPTPIKVSGEIEEIIEHTAELRSFVIVPSRRIPAFTPGQFLHLAIDHYESGAHWPESRVFSIASSPQNRDRLRVTISRQGGFTTRMFSELRVGSQVWLKLPYGSFSPNPDLPGRTVMMAGGSGVTPFISFLEWAESARPNAAVDLHYGARTPEMLIYRSAVERCQAQMPNLRVFYYVEQDAGEESLNRIGRLSPQHAWQQLVEPTLSRFFLSGPKPMIDAFRTQLIALGADSNSVLSDDWS